MAARLSSRAAGAHGGRRSWSRRRSPRWAERGSSVGGVRGVDHRESGPLTGHHLPGTTSSGKRCGDEEQVHGDVDSAWIHRRGCC